MHFGSGLLKYPLSKQIEWSSPTSLKPILHSKEQIEFICFEYVQEISPFFNSPKSSQSISVSRFFEINSLKIYFILTKNLNTFETKFT